MKPHQFVPNSIQSIIFQLRCKWLFVFVFAALHLTASLADFICHHPNARCTKRSDDFVIYSAWNNGCLDGGLFTALDRALIHPNVDCPDLSHIRWKFGRDRSISTVHPNFAATRMCLDCACGASRCVIIGHACTGVVNQKFSIKMHSNLRSDTKGRRRTYFSIRSVQHPKLCLTAINDYHRVTIPYFSTYFYKYYYKEEYYYKVWHSALRLERCTGKDSQIFYITNDPKPTREGRLECKVAW